MTSDDSTNTRSNQRPRLANLAAAVVWLVLVPAACLLALGVLAVQGAQQAAVATEAARSEAEFATVSAYLASPTVGPPTRPLADLPATWALALTGAAQMPATSTPTISPTPSATATATATSTSTAPSSPTTTPTVEGELTIGHSVAGRPITVTQFGSGPVVRLIVAGIHGGNEANTTRLADELTAYLREAPERVPEDVTLYVLRLFNPDGAARGTDIYARANENNVDLNRNWPSRWQPDWSRAGCWKHLVLSGGTEAASEPETQALMAFMLARQVDALISYHSAALSIFAGGQPPDEASLRLAEAVAEVSDYPYPPLDFGCLYTGQLIDWASDQGIAALDVELTNHADTDFEQNQRILAVFLNWRR